MKLYALPFSALLLCVSCAHAASDEKEPLSPSQLNSQISSFNGKNVAVKGFVTLEPGGHNLYESKALKEEFAKRWNSGDKDFDPTAYIKYCLTIANPDFLMKRSKSVAGKTVIAEGKFIDDHTSATRIDLGACPLPTAIVVETVRVVEP